MIAKHKGEIPVVVLLLPFLAGITVCVNYPGINLKWLQPALLLLGAVFISLNFAYNKFNIYKFRWIGGLLITVILFLLGCFITFKHNELNTTNHFSKKPSQYIIATINSEPKIKNDLVRFTVAVNHTVSNNKPQPAGGTLMISIKDEMAKKLFYGEEILIPAKYTTIDPPYNPGEFNYKSYLAYKNIYYQAFLYPSQYSIIKAGQGNPVTAYALQTRQNLVKKLQANMKDTAAIAVASTLILGYKADLSNDILQAYSKTGTIHILSVSGGHVAIIYLLLSWMLGFLKRYKNGKVFMAVTIISLIWVYALLTGFSPAVCRAAIMLSFIIVGKTYSRYINTLNILAVSAFALLLYDPFLLADIGFQLSYLAVAGLVVLQPVIYNWLSVKNRVADKIWMACSVSLPAQIITFPLSAYYFHQFPVYFLLSNLLIIIPVSIILYAGILLLLLPQINGLSKALGYITEHGIILMNKMLAFIEHSLFASVNKIRLTTFEYLLLYVIILLIFYFIYNKKPLLFKVAALCMLFLSISISLKKFKADGTTSITFLNLRKHTGMVFKNGNKGVVITDLPATDKYFLYAIQTGLDSSKITDYRVFAPDDNVASTYLLKQQNLLQFLNKRLLLLNQGAQTASITAKIKPAYLYINNNTYVTANALNIKSALYIIGSNNSDKRIADLQTILKRTGINFKTLKRNKSLTILSN
jgi:competence protein ComEC